MPACGGLSASGTASFRVRSGTARIAIVPKAWDEDVPLEEDLSSFPGAQVQITIPERRPADDQPHRPELGASQSVVRALLEPRHAPDGRRGAHARSSSSSTGIGDRALTVIDFSHVGLLDFSCADEIVAKLLLQYVRSTRRRARCISSSAASARSHIDAIEAVLERHKLALVTQHADGESGSSESSMSSERRAWENICELGAGVGCRRRRRDRVLSCDDAERTLDTLWRRRLVIRHDSGYVAVGSARRLATQARLERMMEGFQPWLHGDPSTSSTRKGDPERGPAGRLHPSDARTRLLEDGELVWVYGPQTSRAGSVRRR